MAPESPKEPSLPLAVSASSAGVPRSSARSGRSSASHSCAPVTRPVGFPGVPSEQVAGGGPPLLSVLRPYAHFSRPRSRSPRHGER